MQAIILAGGTGSRLKPMQRKPKSLTPMRGITFLEHQLTWLDSIGIDDVVVSTAKVVYEKWEDSFPKEPIYALEEDKLGTGGAIKFASEFLRNEYEPFYVMNVDDFLFGRGHDPKFDAHKYIQLRRFSTIFYTKSPPLPFSLIKTEGELIISNYIRNPVLREVNVSVGHYIFTFDFIRELPKVGDLEDKIPELIQKYPVAALPVLCNWKTVNDAKQYRELLEYLEELNNVKKVLQMD